MERQNPVSQLSWQYLMVWHDDCMYLRQAHKKIGCLGPISPSLHQTLRSGDISSPNSSHCAPHSDAARKTIPERQLSPFREAPYILEHITLQKSTGLCWPCIILVTLMTTSYCFSEKWIQPIAFAASIQLHYNRLFQQGGSICHWRFIVLLCNGPTIGLIKLSLVQSICCCQVAHQTAHLCMRKFSLSYVLRRSGVWGGLNQMSWQWTQSEVCNAWKGFTCWSKQPERGLFCLLCRMVARIHADRSVQLNILLTELRSWLTI